MNRPLGTQVGKAWPARECDSHQLRRANKCWDRGPRLRWWLEDLEGLGPGFRIPLLLFGSEGPTQAPIQVSLRHEGLRGRGRGMGLRNG